MLGRSDRSETGIESTSFARIVEVVKDRIGNWMAALRWARRKEREADCLIAMIDVYCMSTTKTMCIYL